MQVTIEVYGKPIAEETIRVSSDVSLLAEIDAAIQRVADRLCLALADRVDQPVLTADAAWGTEGRVRQIR